VTKIAYPLQFVLAAICVLALSSCAFLPQFGRSNVVPPPLAETVNPDPAAKKLAPLVTRYFKHVSPHDEVLGEVQIIFTHDENTFSDIAREYDLGYQELRIANPDVDPWLPGSNTPVYLPTMVILPEAPRDGLVINLPSMRLLYFQAENSESSKNVSDSVTSYPIGIGREGWRTPVGAAYVTQKVANPKWYPPASVRAEHAELGDPLPRMVPSGPDNPLGLFKMKLSMPGYLIHGTNKPGGVGMRVSHGCIRLYPEDIETLFERVPVKTPVHIIDEPVLAGWRSGELYLEVHPPLAEDERALEAEAERVIAEALQRAGRENLALDHAVIRQIILEKRGIPFPILEHKRTLEQYLTESRIIRNRVPLAASEKTASR